MGTPKVRDITTRTTYSFSIGFDSVKYEIDVVSSKGERGSDIVTYLVRWEGDIKERVQLAERHWPRVANKNTVEYLIELFLKEKKEKVKK